MDPLLGITSEAPHSTPAPIQPETKPVKPVIKPATEDALFFDEAPPLSSEVPPTRPKPGPTASSEVSKRPQKQKIGGLFDDDASDDDLFPSPSPAMAAKKPEAVADIEPPEKKPLPGAVQLFGGVDLFGAGRPGSKVKEEREKAEPSQEKRKKDALFGKLALARVTSGESIYLGAMS